MPWKQTIPMEQKIEIICEWKTGKYTITDWCNAFGISRPTAYKLIGRFEQSGFDGLRDHSRTPRNHPNQTSENIIESILGLKKKYPRLGAKKLRVLLFNESPNQPIPYVVTVHNILKKNGFVFTKKKMRRIKPVFPIFDPKECDEVWSADYKGKVFNRQQHLLPPSDNIRLQK